MGNNYSTWNGLKVVAVRAARQGGRRVGRRVKALASGVYRPDRGGCEDPLVRDPDGLQPLGRLSAEEKIDESKDLKSENESTSDEAESDFLTRMTVLEDELKEVRLNLAKTKGHGQYIPLCLYRSGQWNSISVSDIKSGMWCEVQLEYKYLYPHMKTTVEWQNMKKKGKPVQLKTPTMMHGLKIHLKKEMEVHKIVEVKTVSREDKWAVDLGNIYKKLEIIKTDTLEREIRTFGEPFDNDNELEVHKIVKVKTESREDKWAVGLITIYKQLEIIKTGALEREIRTFGEPFDNDILVKGIIDQIQFSDGELTILDFKTRKTCKLPSEAQKKVHSLQLMLYKHMLDSMTCGATDMKVLAKHLKLNFDLALNDTVLEYVEKCGLLSSFGKYEHSNARSKRQRLTDTVLEYIEKCGLLSLFGKYVHSNARSKRQRLTYPAVTFGALVNIISNLIVQLQLPPVSNLLIQYEHQESGTVIGVDTVTYNEDWMKKVVKHSLAFWRGHRPSSGVDIEDLWKCNHCQFSDVCVWRMRKVLETSPAARQTLPTVCDKTKNVL